MTRAFPTRRASDLGLTDPPDEPSGEHVEDERDGEQQQGHEEQALERESGTTHLIGAGRLRGDRCGHGLARLERVGAEQRPTGGTGRSEEHTSELQSLMRISYAVSCLKKKTK